MDFQLNPRADGGYDPATPIPQPIDLSDVADLMQPGEQFDVINLDADGVSVQVGKVVAAESAVGQDLVADMQARMAAFHEGAQKIVNSNEWKRARGYGYTVTRERSKRTAQSKAKFKAQRKARKAQRRK